MRSLIPGKMFRSKTNRMEYSKVSIRCKIDYLIDEAAKIGIVIPIFVLGVNLQFIDDLFEL